MCLITFLYICVKSVVICLNIWEYVCLVVSSDLVASGHEFNYFGGESVELRDKGFVLFRGSECGIDVILEGYGGVVYARRSRKSGSRCEKSEFVSVYGPVIIWFVWE